MDSNQIKGKWKQIEGEAKKIWGKLTDDDWKQAEGNIDSLSGRIQERYGDTKEAVKQRLDQIVAKFNEKVEDVNRKFDRKTDKAQDRPPSVPPNKVL